MAVKIGNVNTFPDVYADKEQVMKIFEESAEVFSAWEHWNLWRERCERAITDIEKHTRGVYEADYRRYLLEECADVIQAICNLLAALGVEDFTEWMQVVEEKNRDRGRYGL